MSSALRVSIRQSRLLFQTSLLTSQPALLTPSSQMASPSVSYVSVNGGPCGTPDSPGLSSGPSRMWCGSRRKCRCRQHWRRDDVGLAEPKEREVLARPRWGGGGGVRTGPFSTTAAASIERKLVCLVVGLAEASRTPLDINPELLHHAPSSSDSTVRIRVMRIAVRVPHAGAAVRRRGRRVKTRERRAPREARTCNLPVVEDVRVPLCPACTAYPPCISAPA